MRFHNEFLMDSVTQPVIKLRRIKDFIPCPGRGCTQKFQQEDDCAEHLLKTCIRFHSNDDFDSRRNFFMWIIDYFKTCSFDQQNQPNAVKINSVLNDSSISSSLKATLKVNIPELPETICCPVCKKYFETGSSCADHLFRECIDSERSSRVQEWLFEYFSSKTERNLALLQNFSTHFPSPKIYCKYCKTEALDKESLMEHFPCPFRSIYENCQEAVCAVCNFSALNEKNLVAHILIKHIRCHCGFRIKNDSQDFLTFKHHLKVCDPNNTKSVRCPLCYGDVPVEEESKLKEHIVNCKKNADRIFDCRSMYGECDICSDDILLCDVDTHLRKHLRQGDGPSRQKPLRISKDDLNYAGERFSYL